MKICEICGKEFESRAWNARVCKEDHFLNCADCGVQVKIPSVDAWYTYKNNIAKPMCKRCKSKKMSGVQKKIYSENKRNSIKFYSEDIELKKLTYEKYKELIKKDGDFELIGYKKPDMEILCKSCNRKFKREFSILWRPDKIQCPYCKPPYTSNKELELMSFIKSFGYNVQKLEKGHGSLFELDLYIPELNIAFEYNGGFYHSCNPYMKHMFPKYHHNKQVYFLNKGIKVYHLWEHWGDTICKSIIEAKLRKTKKLYGPKLDIVYPTKNECQNMLKEYHCDGWVSNSYSVGLKYKGEVISLITMRKLDIGWELSRFITKPGISIIEGFSTLVRKMAEDIDPDVVTTYCYSDMCPDYRDSVYYKSGWEYIHSTDKTMRYYKMSTGDVVQRRGYQKKNLKELFPDSYSDDKTELEILAENKIYPIYDSGIHKFILRKK